MKHVSVPVKEPSSSPLAPFNARSLDGCGVVMRDGIFYASLKMQGQETPLVVALHGVRSEPEALEAFATLVRLRQANCGCPSRLRV